MDGGLDVGFGSGAGGGIGGGGGGGGGGGASSCPTCGSAELETNESSGDTVCTVCGTVLEESHIVSSIEFIETSAGTSSVIGQFVSATATKPYGVSGPGYGLSRESREVAIENGRRMIHEVAQSRG